MTLLVLSPHQDDAIFSVGEHLLSRPGVTIATVMGGTPEDEAGRLKAKTLRAEHHAACRSLGALDIAALFLDDVYPAPDAAELGAVLRSLMVEIPVVWLPLGIHHPDHRLVAALALYVWQSITPRPALAIYEELPYRVLYPEETAERLAEVRTVIGFDLKLGGYAPNVEGKRALIDLYPSQNEGDVQRCCFAPERLWEVVT